MEKNGKEWIVECENTHWKTGVKSWSGFNKAFDIPRCFEIAFIIISDHRYKDRNMRLRNLNTGVIFPKEFLGYGQ